MARPVCQIQPENVTMVRVFGAAMLVASVTAVVTGRAYCRGVIVREESPVGFWATVAGMGLLGAMCVVGSFVC